MVSVHYVRTLCRYIVSVHSVCTLCWYIVSVHSVGTLCRYILLAHRVGTLCRYILLIPKMYPRNIVTCLWLLSTTVTVNSLSAGVKMRLTDKGLRYIGNIAKLQIINLVKQISIPDLEGNADQIYYSIKNTTVDEVNEPKINIQLTPTESGNNDAALFVSNLSLVVSTDYNVSYSVLNIANLPLSGTVKAVFDQVDIHFKLSLVPDDGYRTVPQSSDCEVNINNFNLLFTGDFSWLLNLLQNIFTGRIKSSIQEQICIYMIQSLDNNGANKTKELQLTSTFADVFVIDYVHTSPIVFADNYMEGDHLGEVYWKAGRKPSPLTPSPLPEFQVDNTRMVYILLSDYPAETLAYVAHSEGYLQYTLTADKNLPPVGVQHFNGHQQLTLADFLRTTCSDGRCVGSIIPELGTKYPQSYVKVDLKSNQTPSVEVTSDVISVVLYGNMDLSVHVRADDYLNFLSLQVVLTLTATPYIKDGRLSASILQYRRFQPMNLYNQAWTIL